MPRPRSKRLRWHQIHRWLQAEFPTARPTILKVMAMPRGERGDCTRYGQDLVIRMSPRLPWEYGNEILFHEYAHAMTWPLAKIEHEVLDHSDEWGLAYARLYRAFEEDDGDLRSDDY